MQSLHPTVVLMDIQMPDIDGIQATRQLCAAGTTAKILILTTFGADDNVVAALRAGASGFLLKDSPRLALVAAVRAVASGDAALDPAVLERLVRQHGRLKAPDTPSIWDGSHLGRPRSSGWSARGPPTMRSRSCSSSRKPRSRPTSPGPRRSSAPETGSSSS